MIKRLPQKVGGFFSGIVKARGDSKKAARKKRRLKALLDWLAKGSEHACPT